MSMYSACVFALLASLATANPLRGYEDGRDQHHFVTRPELRPPRYVVTKHNPRAITPGYWFVAPYSSLQPQGGTSRLDVVPFQTGAHIYDSDGELVWSGAAKYDNRNVFGFRPLEINGTQMMSMFIDLQDIGAGFKNRTAVILDNQYREVTRVEQHDMDFHEFAPSPDGKSAIIGFQWETTVGAESLGQEKRMITGKGFRTIAMITGEMQPLWDPLAHGLTLSESRDEAGKNKSTDIFWDYLHMNSIDKTARGDYLVSSRNTHSIILVDGQTGGIMWRLGGNKSDFSMTSEDDFHWQHDARMRYQNETHSIISLLDNRSSDPKVRREDSREHVSAAKIMLLDHKAMTAVVMRRLERPDDGTSFKLGNVQTLGPDSTGSVFVNWGLEGYLSEFDASNNLVMEAKMTTGRMMTYRAFKAPFVAAPAEPPVLKIRPTMQGGQGDMATAFFVSWNGATEVDSWAFYANATGQGAMSRVAVVKKRGFETSWSMPGKVDWARADALDRNGAVIGVSDLAEMTDVVHDETDSAVLDVFDVHQIDLPGLGAGGLYCLLYGFALVGIYHVLQVWTSHRWRRTVYTAIHKV